MAEASRRAYRSLVYEDPEFWSFFTQATPIAHISRLPIASRPSSRRGSELVGLEELRAIPWVFAWVQSRYTVPGWYGLGSALERFVEGQASDARERAARLRLLQRMCRTWAFFQTVMDNAELELIRCRLDTARWYASLTTPPELGERIHAVIASEHARTLRWVSEVTGHGQLLANAPAVRSTVDFRNPLVVPLSRLQVELLRRMQDGTESAKWREAMLLSITGLAAAMQSTG